MKDCKKNSRDDTKDPFPKQTMVNNWEKKCIKDS